MYSKMQETVNKNRINDEQNVYYSWENQIGNQFIENGNRVEIIHTGKRNYVSGPDYKNAKIMINNSLIIGDVEIHVSCNDWYNHKHHIDPQYSCVILHVISSGRTHKVIDNLGREIPTIKIATQPIKNKCCVHISKDTSSESMFEIIESFAELRWEMHKNYFRNLDSEIIVQRMFHLLDVQGNTSIKNKLSSYFLTHYKVLSINVLIDKLIEMFASSPWKMGCRYPASQPSSRIPILTILLNDILNARSYPTSLKELLEFNKSVSKDYSVPGKQFLIEIMGNLILPLQQQTTNKLLFNEWFQLPTQSYGKCKQLLKQWDADISISFGVQQGLLFLMNELCNTQSCDHCPIIKKTVYERI